MNSSKHSSGSKCHAVFALALCLGAVLLALVPDSLAQAEADTSLRLIQSNADSVVLELRVSRYTVQPQKVGATNFSILSIPGLDSAASPGKPRLPVRGALVGIPPGAQVSLRILSDDVRQDALANPPLPGATTRLQFDPTQMLPRGETEAFAQDSAAYASSPGRVYPPDAARITSVGNFRGQRYVAVEFSPLQYDPGARQLLFHRQSRVELSFTYPAGAARAGASPTQGPFESVLQENLINFDSAKNWRTRGSVSPAAARRSASYTGGPWFKIAVSTDGLYKVTCAKLRDEAGLDPAGVDPATFKVFKGESELAITASWPSDGQCDDNHYLLFFGRGISTKYTNTNVYWLTYGGLQGKGSILRDGNGATPATAFTDTIHLEHDLMYRSYFPKVASADHWFWNYLAPSYPPPYQIQSQEYTFQATNPVRNGISPTVQVDLWGFSGGHHTQVFVNNNKIYENASWTGQAQLKVAIPFSQDFLTTTNTLRVTELAGDANDFVFANGFDISYTRGFSATNGMLQFRQAQGGTWRYQIDGFDESDVHVFDVTDGSDMARIGNVSVAPSSCPCSVTFSDSVSAPREYIAITPASFKSPLSVVADTAPVPDLHSTNNAADEIIISYGAFMANVEPLKNLREAHGLRVKLVDVQDVYDEFSDGRMDPQAIRDFLAYAYANWQPPSPSFVLLVGDTTLDPKGNCVTPGVCPGLTTPLNSTLIPTFLVDVDTQVGETASDNRFVSFNDASGDTLPQMMIGRLPANSVDEVKDMVIKIVNYEMMPAGGDWRTKMLFVADMPEYGSDFWSFSDGVAGDSRYVPAPMMADRIYYGQAGYTDAGATRQAITSTINAGRLIVSYVGHGAINSWSSGPLLTSDDAAALSNGSKLPMMLDVTCMDGYFIFPGIPSLAETSVRSAKGGSLASWASTGWGQPVGLDLLERGFIDSIFWSQSPIVGSAAMSGKINLWLNGGGANRNLIDVFTLFGDPASRVNIPLLRRAIIPFIAR